MSTPRLIKSASSPYIVRFSNENAKDKEKEDNSAHHHDKKGEKSVQLGHSKILTHVLEKTTDVQLQPHYLVLNTGGGNLKESYLIETPHQPEVKIQFSKYLKETAMNTIEVEQLGSGDHHHKRLKQQTSILFKELENTPGWFSMIMYLSLMGIFVAIIGTSIDILISLLHQAHRDFMDLGSHIGMRCFLWVSFVVIGVLFSVTFTRLVSPAAAGSGIPQFKAILSGAEISGFFEPRTLLTKIVGLSSFLGSGMVAGKEGAFIHIATIIAYQLAQSRFFQKLFCTTAMKERAYSAASALGVSANWGAPVSGVLFSIEVTSVYYPTRTYWFVAVSSAVGGFIFRILWNIYLGYTDKPMLPYIPAVATPRIASWVDIIAVVILGLILGPFSGIFNRLVSSFLHFRVFFSSKLQPKIGSVAFIYLWSISGALITGLLTFPGFFEHLGTNSVSALQQLVKRDDISYQVFCQNTTESNITVCTQQHVNWEVGGSIFWGLLTFICTRILLQLIAISVPAPGGVYVPVATLGGACGRLMGETVKLIYPASLHPSVYTIIGAGALPGGVTGAISTAIVVVELTGDSTSLILVFICTLMSVYIGSLIHESIFMTLIKFLKLPFLPDLKHNKYSLSARHILENVVYLEQRSSLNRLQYILGNLEQMVERNPSNFEIPVVVDLEHPFLLGCIYFHTLKRFVDAFAATTNEECQNLGISTEELSDLDFNLPRCLHKIVHGVPIQFTLDSSIVDIHHAFVISHLSNAFVTYKGKLVGMITWNGLKEVLKEK